MPYKDPERQREYQRKYQREYSRRLYVEDDEFRRKKLAASKRHYVKYKQQVAEVLDRYRKNGCIRCGEKDVSCLQFHHRDPTQKEFDIGRWTIMRQSAQMERLYAELAKCVVMCANCHFKFHAGRFML